jgi:hypothetical protein
MSLHVCIYMFIYVYLYFYGVSLCVCRSEDDEAEQRKAEEVCIIRGDCGCAGEFEAEEGGRGAFEAG